MKRSTLIVMLLVLGLAYVSLGEVVQVLDFSTGLARFEWVWVVLSRSVHSSFFWVDLDHSGCVWVILVDF